jgi:DNA-binding Xre family transcriptional regulator
MVGYDHYSSLYPIWKGAARTYRWICLGHWRIREAAQAKSLTFNDLGWAAEILPHSLAPMWNYRQKFVFVETLFRLARALELEVGDLFGWEDDQNTAE